MGGGDGRLERGDKLSSSQNTPGGSTRMRARCPKASSACRAPRKGAPSQHAGSSSERALVRATLHCTAADCSRPSCQPSLHAVCQRVCLNFCQCLSVCLHSCLTSRSATACCTSATVVGSAANSSSRLEPSSSGDGRTFFS